MTGVKSGVGNQVQTEVWGESRAECVQPITENVLNRLIKNGVQ